MLGVLRIRKPFQLHTFPEDHTVCASAVMEHANLIALLDVLAFLHSGLARRDFSHSNSHEANQAQVFVISFKEDDGARSCCCKVTLACFLAAFVDIAPSGGITKTLEERFGEVSAFNNVRLHDLTADRRVPAVVAQRRKEGLVDSSTDELLVQWVHGQHVRERIGLALHPKAVALGDVAAYLIRLRFTGVSDDAIVVRTGNGPLVFVEMAREEVIPGLVPMVLLRRIAVEELFESIRCLANVGCQREIVSAVIAEPADLVVTKHVC